MKHRLYTLSAALLTLPALIYSADLQEGEMAGYLFGPTEKVPEEFNGGFSLYAAAWPLVATYPGHRFQTGLCGTWMHPQYEEGKKPEGKCYTDIEGGLGWWRDTHFPTTTPKFIMGGVGPNFSFIANGPGYGAGTWEKPRSQYGVAQLSPWLLFPLDGLNLKQGTSGELFGYGYLPLPLTNPKTTTAGKLAMLLRARYADPRIKSVCKTDGLAFRVRDVVTGVEVMRRDHVAGLLGLDGFEEVVGRLDGPTVDRHDQVGRRAQPHRPVGRPHHRSP